MPFQNIIIHLIHILSNNYKDALQNTQSIHALAGIATYASHSTKKNVISLDRYIHVKQSLPDAGAGLGSFLRLVTGPLYYFNTNSTI